MKMPEPPWPLEGGLFETLESPHGKMAYKLFVAILPSCHCDEWGRGDKSRTWVEKLHSVSSFLHYRVGGGDGGSEGGGGGGFWHRVLMLEIVSGNIYLPNVPTTVYCSSSV